ncbi:MAG TPA: ATP-binding protein [Polyangiaceae bacterium]|nr:ATP-binding protein [Polyangiaceae bacterium]
MAEKEIRTESNPETEAPAVARTGIDRQEVQLLGRALALRVRSGVLSKRWPPSRRGRFPLPDDDEVPDEPEEAALPSELAELRVRERRAERRLLVRLAPLARMFGLSGVAVRVLAVAVVLSEHLPLRELFNQRSLSEAEVLAMLADATRSTVLELQVEFDDGGSLTCSGLLSTVARWEEVPLTLPRGLPALVLDGQTTPDRVVALLVQPAPPSELELSAFGHVAAEARQLRVLLGGAVAAGAAGINALVYGVTGVGKTALARALARELDVTLFVVRDANDDGHPLSRDQRLRAWVAAQHALKWAPRALLLLDEAEDLLEPGPGDGPFGPPRRVTRDKSWIHGLLEHSRVPTIWIANTVAGLDPATLRRFVAAVELGPPPREVRRRLLGDALGAAPLGAACLDRLASDERLTPAHVELARRVVELARAAGADGTEELVTRAIDDAFRVAGAAPAAPPALVTPRYDLGFVNASEDLAALAAALERSARGTLCLYGPPGTGKTEYVRYLAARSGLQLLVVRASDLMNKYVGETERAIAGAFARAARTRSLLFLDEADSMLRDRASAHQRWEVTETNELLTQIDAFPGLFVAATNLVDSLDEASLRRFAFKIRFDPLRPEQRRAMLAALVGAPPPPELFGRLDALDLLTPGDFTAAARRLRTLHPDAPLDPTTLVDRLAEEHALKRGARRRVGFGR